MKRSLPERQQHPVLETYERVLNSGVMVERSSAKAPREIWVGVSLAGIEVFGMDTDVSIHLLARPTWSKPTRED